MSERIEIIESTPLSGWRRDVKSIHEQLNEKVAALSAAGKHEVVRRVLASKDSVEKQLAECDQALVLRETTRKHNGPAHNGKVELTESQRLTTEKEAIVKSLQTQGFSEAEAKAVMGLDENDPRIKQLVDAGVSTEDAWKVLMGVL